MEEEGGGDGEKIIVNNLKKQTTMIKRLFYVLLILVGIVFVPYPVGVWAYENTSGHFDAHKIVSWPLFYLFGLWCAMVTYVLITIAIPKLYKYIRYGSLVLVLFFGLSASAQKEWKPKPIDYCLKNADSVFIKHYDDKDSVLEWTKLNHGQIVLLEAAFSVPDTSGLMSKCFFPHHDVVIYRGTHINGVRICFQCERYSSSDFIITKPFDWQLMRTTFLNLGVKL